MNRSIYLQMLDDIPPEQMGNLVAKNNDLTVNRIRRNKGLSYPQYDYTKNTTAMNSAMADAKNRII